MNRVLACDVCRYSRAVPEDYGGQKVRCPQCAAVILVGQEAAREPSPIMKP